MNTIDGLMLKEMFLSGAANINANREAIDALNVFPVPDGDTGTNMCQTMNAAVKDLHNRTFPSVYEVANCAAKGALRGARGNPGVILSQILRGFAKGLEGAEEMDAELLVKALRSGADMAYKAIMKPKEGTILTVARVTADDMTREAQKTQDLVELFDALIGYSNAILKKTPDMLPVLKSAGVVDSGGKGLVTIFAGFYAALTGKPIEVDTEVAAVSTEIADEHATSVEDIRFAYCTEFIVSHPKPDMRESDVVRLRERLERIGDCVVVVSDMSIVKVHVHTNDPGRALQMALELGELDSIKIDNMLEEARERQAKRQAEEAAKVKEYGIVSVALGAGFTQIFNDLMVDKLVDGGQTMNPSIEDLYEAIESTHAKNVFVLPNNTNIILAAQQAGELTEKNVAVLPTKSVAMGIAAAIAFNPDAPFEENLATMTEAAERVHTASITYAVRDTVFEGLEIHEGNIMGLIDNKVKLLGDDVEDVAKRLLAEMVTEESELITIYHGADVSEERAADLEAFVSDTYGDCEVMCYNGGQPLYYYFIAVE